jgi:hypothetical protein
LEVKKQGIEFGLLNLKAAGFVVAALFFENGLIVTKVGA